MAIILDLAQEIRKAGYKLTSARLAVIDVLESSHDHLCHSQILEAGKKIYPSLSRATVYRTMDILVELNLLRPLYLNDPAQRFASAVGGHHHLICTDCGKIIEFYHCSADKLAQQLAENFDFLIRNHLLEFQGVCETCRRN